MIPIACCQRIEHDAGDVDEAVRRIRGGVVAGRRQSAVSRDVKGKSAPSQANMGVAETHDAGALLQDVAGALTGGEVSCAIADQACRGCVGVGEPRDSSEFAVLRVCPGAVGIAYRLTVGFPDQAHLDSCWTRTEHAVSDGQGYIKSRSVHAAVQLWAIEYSRCSKKQYGQMKTIGARLFKNCDTSEILLLTGEGDKVCRDYSHRGCGR